MQNKITEYPAEEAVAAAAVAAAVDDRATIDWGRTTKLGVEMKNILPSSLGEIGGGGGAPDFVLQERGERSTRSIFWADNLESVLSCVLRPWKVNFEGPGRRTGPKDA